MKSGKGSSKIASSGFKLIELSKIDRPEEISRMDINPERLQELANSIKERGLLEPILVHPKGERYGIIGGDRRYLAHELLGEKKIMCRILNISGKEIIIDRAIENLQREDLTPFEEAYVYNGLVENHKMSTEEISELTGKSVAVVQRRIAILKMPDSFQKAIHEGRVSMTVAEELWSTPNAAKREYFLELAIEHGITMLVARSWVQDYRREIRTSEDGNVRGAGNPMEYEDVPIYRACDVCRGPSTYEELCELRICPGCNKKIRSALDEQT